MKQQDGVRRRDVAEWLSDSVADAERRGLPQLKPLLEGLAQSTSALRAADWNDGSLQVPKNKFHGPMSGVQRPM